MGFFRLSGVFRRFHFRLLTLEEKSFCLARNIGGILYQCCSAEAVLEWKRTRTRTAALLFWLPLFTHPSRCQLLSFTSPVTNHLLPPPHPPHLPASHPVTCCSTHTYMWLWVSKTFLLLLKKASHAWLGLKLLEGWWGVCRLRTISRKHYTPVKHSFFNISRQNPMPGCL